MKLSTKMILIFSVMFFLIVTINTFYLTQVNISGADAFSASRYQNMAANMLRNVEQYVSTMDLAIEDLTSDTTFMEAFYRVATHEEDEAGLLADQNKIFQALYHSPIADSFYRVSLFSENGFFISNHIDRNDSIVSLSDESMEMIAGIPYLKAVRSAPYRRHLIGPHKDYFSVSKNVTVFSAVHALTWHGQHVGYIEVAAHIAELDQLLLTDNSDVMIRVMFSDGSILYATPEDEAVYDDIPLDQFQSYTDPTGLERNVYHAQSRWLGLDFYLAEDAVVRQASVIGISLRFFGSSLLLTAAAIVVIIVVSLSLTYAIRRLNKRVRDLPVEHLMLQSDTSPLSAMVTTARNKEIYELETSFNQLLLALHDASRNEMSLRESSLRSHLAALQAQINPHFVYNTLNIIAAKGMESGNEDIIDMCSQFAQMLRYSTDTHAETATLGEDLEHVTNYLLLLKARYEEHLVYAIDVPDSMRDFVVPKLTLQPLVENAIVHGFDRGSHHTRRITIKGTIEGRQLCLEIRDNGCGFAPDTLRELQQAIEQIERHDIAMPESEGHIGLLNTCLRLHYYSKGAVHMALMNDQGAVVRLTIQQPI